MICKKCGKEIPEGSLFCNNCGSKVMGPVDDTKEETSSKLIFGIDREKAVRILMIAIFALSVICALGSIPYAREFKEKESKKAKKELADTRIAIPMSSKQLEGSDYRDVMNQLNEAGFNNIKLERIEDLITGWITKDGEVEEVTINRKYFNKGDKFDAGVEIVISYHTFKSDNKEPGNGSSQENAGIVSDGPTPDEKITDTPTPEPTATNTPTPEPTATNTPMPEPTATNTPTPTATNTPTPTEKPVVKDNKYQLYTNEDDGLYELTVNEYFKVDYESNYEIGLVKANDSNTTCFVSVFSVYAKSRNAYEKAYEIDNMWGALPAIKAGGKNGYYQLAGETPSGYQNYYCNFNDNGRLIQISIMIRPGNDTVQDMCQKVLGGLKRLS